VCGGGGAGDLGDAVVVFFRVLRVLRVSA
jgi:hypothetical protein